MGTDPTETHPGTGRTLALGVDVGGTRIKAGLVDAAGRVVARAAAPTPPRTAPGQVAQDAVVAVVEQLLSDPAAVCGVAGVGVAVAGFVDATSGTVVFAPHLAWRDEPLRERLTSRLGRPVVVVNDANAAAWAEWRLGAGAGAEDLLVVTLGTGIGGAHVVDGRLQRGRHGLAGEYGHLQVVPDGRDCECGHAGCWEQYASGSVLRRAGAALVRAGDPRAAALARRCGGDPDRLQGEDVTLAAKEGDAAARELLAEVGRWLGVGLAGLVGALDPGRVVVGGGVSEAGDLLLDPAREALAARLPGRGHRPVPEVRAALLGVDAGLVGASLLARDGRSTGSDGRSTG